MNSSGMLTFTASPNGKLKLHDSTRDALEVKHDHDVVFQISLTKHQMTVVAKAEVLAGSKKRDAQVAQFPGRS